MKNLRFKSENAKMLHFHGYLNCDCIRSVELLQYKWEVKPRTWDTLKYKVIVIKDQKQRKDKIAHPMYNLDKFFPALI